MHITGFMFALLCCIYSSQKPENSNIFQKTYTINIRIKLPNPSLFQSHKLFPNRIQNGYIFSYEEQAQSSEWGSGGGGGGLYCTGRRSRLQVYESVGMSYERVEKSVISVLTP